jgi:cardiolipin synthase
VKQIPNLLSAARLALAPYFFLLLWREQYAIALAVCVICGVTDGLDGLAARYFHANSRIGAYLDPIADKVLLSGAFVTLALRGTIEIRLAAIVLGRDVFILLMVAAGFLFTSVRSFPPTIWGKASTTAQIWFILMLIIHRAGFIGNTPVLLLQWLTVALAVWSGVDYAWRGLSILRRTDRGAAAIMEE